MAFEAVSFDLFDTLVDLHMETLPRYTLNGVERRGTHGALHAAVARLAPISLERFAQSLAGVDRDLRDAHPVEGRELPTLERFRELAKRLEIEAPGLPLELTRIHMDAIRGQARPLAHHPGVLARLKGHFLLGVCSNFSHAATARRVLEEQSLGGAFHATVFSEEVGLRKPRPQIFHALLDALGVEPGAVLHVGDRLEEDVRGAAEVGMRTAWITRRCPDPGAALGAHRGPQPDHVIADLAELPALLGVDA
jgi:HAD superfamily hydrolase (TIGR01549 family)